MDKKYSDLIFIFIFLILILTFLYIVNIVKSDGAKCLASPITYGLNDFEIQNNQTISCTCYATRFEGTIYLNSKNISIIPKVIVQDNIYNQNFSFKLEE